MRKITVLMVILNGRSLMYPICDLSKALCALLGKYAMNSEDVEHIRKLGYEIETRMDEEKGAS